MSQAFIDSKVFLYLLSGDTGKADQVQALLAAGAVISVQALNEVTSVCLRKLKMPWPEIEAVLLAVKTACKLVPLTVATHDRAVELANASDCRFTMPTWLPVPSYRVLGCC